MGYNLVFWSPGSPQKIPVLYVASDGFLKDSQERPMLCVHGIDPGDVAFTLPVVEGRFEGLWVKVFRI